MIIDGLWSKAGRHRENPQSDLLIQYVGEETNSNWTFHSLCVLVGRFSLVLVEELWIVYWSFLTYSAHLLGHRDPKITPEP